jgi:hypothetical protein
MADEAEVKKAPEPPKFIGTKPRSEKVPLEWPVEYDGKVWDEIEVRRMSVTDIATMSDDSRNFPMFDAPREVMDALDVDDDIRVREVADRFLPQGFKAKKEP